MRHADPHSDFATVFDAVAHAYANIRPTYPPALFDDIVSFARLAPTARIVEIGSGAGQATWPFAQRGYDVTCIEPGANLVAAARQKLGSASQVRFEITTFEQWNGRSAAFDLLFAGTSFHWVKPDVGYAKAAAVLKPGGTLAIFSNMHLLADVGVWSSMSEVYQRLAPHMYIPLPKDPLARLEPVIKSQAKAIGGLPQFRAAEVRRYPWSASYTTQEYLNLLGTYSDHLRLPQALRERMFAEFATLIDANGGHLVKDYLAVLHMALRR